MSLWRICEGNPPLALVKLVASKIARKIKRMFSKEEIHRRRRRVLRVAMLPFEEQHSVDAGRLESCKSVFTYEDTDTGGMNSIPACMWIPYRNEVLKKISDKYGVVDHKGNLKTPGSYAIEAKQPVEQPVA